MNYTACRVPNEYEGTTIQERSTPAIPPLNETMRRTHDVLVDANAIADKLLMLIANAADDRKEPERPTNSMNEGSMLNCDLACAVMHKLEGLMSLIAGGMNDGL